VIRSKEFQDEAKAKAKEAEAQVNDPQDADASEGLLAASIVDYKFIH